jgi:Tho complex subunit 7
MASFPFLEQRDEEELHKTRLLNVETKPFNRVAKRLLTPGSLLTTPNKPLTPPPDNAEEAAVTQEAEQQKQLEDRRQFREDILLDFAAFDSSIARIQFLRNSNERERERYKADKQWILKTAQDVRDNTAQLRIQLEEAKKTLEQRKKFDELTEKIYANKMLRPREDQEAQLQKLEEDCRELERESQAYGETWKERREQFGRIVEEGMQLRRLIRDEKEEVERREGMDGGDEDGEVGEGSRGGQTPKHSSMSGNVTPRPDGPSQNSPERGLKPRPHGSGTLSRPGSRATSRAPSPAVSERRREEAVEDSSMEVDGSTADDAAMAEATDSQIEVETLIVTVEEPIEDQAALINAGEAVVEDKMDTT